MKKSKVDKRRKMRIEILKRLFLKSDFWDRMYMHITSMR